MKRKPNKPSPEAAPRQDAPEGSPDGARTEATSGQNVQKSKFRQKSNQEQAASSKLRMEKRGEKLEQAKDKLSKQKPPKKPGPVRRVGRAAGGAVHGFVHPC